METDENKSLSSSKTKQHLFNPHTVLQKRNMLSKYNTN